MKLSLDFTEFIELLNTHSVQYLVIGGYAVAFHGHPRFTKDLDVWIGISKQNAENLMNALQAFGFGETNLTAQDFQSPGYTIQLGYPPHRIDLLTTANGVDFNECYASRIEEESNGLKICFINLENLCKNKATTGRHQDLADLDNLQ